jgi:hypothetical protein
MRIITSLSPFKNIIFNPCSHSKKLTKCDLMSDKDNSYTELFNYKHLKTSKHMEFTSKLSIINNKGLQNQEKFKTETPEFIIYCEDWSCGEVEWEFAKNEDRRIYTLIIPPTKNKMYLSNNNNNNNNENNLKKIMAISSGLIRALYEDIVKIETILDKLHNIDFVHYISETSLIDAFTISFIGMVSLGYKQSIKRELYILKSQTIKKKELTLTEIENYLKLQKIIKTFAFCLLLIFTKNVKSVE